jgi:hypothetical protein
VYCLLKKKRVKRGMRIFSLVICFFLMLYQRTRIIKPSNLIQHLNQVSFL